MQRAKYLCLLPLICLCGCAAEPSIKGTWESTDGRPVTIEFGIDTAEWDAEVYGMQLHITGTYTRDKNRIYIKNLKLPFDPQVAKMVAPKLADVDLKSGIDAAISFKNNDEIILTGHQLIDGSYQRKTK